MAHEKIAAASPVPPLVSFYYTSESVFSESSLRSMYQAVSKPDADTLELVDKFSITEDERDMHLRLTRDAVYDVFQTLIKYTKAIPSAIFFNTSYTPAGGDAALTSGVKIVDTSAGVDDASYNENYLVAIDENLQKALQFRILRDWFLMKGLDDDGGKFNALYLDARRIFIHAAFQLKKPLLS